MEIITDPMEYLGFQFNLQSGPKMIVRRDMKNIKKESLNGFV
jgi:hypothetical protein